MFIDVEMNSKQFDWLIKGIKQASNKILYFRRLVVYLYDTCFALMESHCSFYCKSVTTKSVSFIACF